MPLPRCFALLPLALIGAAALPAVEHPEELRPLLRTYCYDCHGVNEAEEDLDYESMTDDELLANGELLDVTLWMVDENEMPPKKAEPAMTKMDRMTMVKNLEHALAALENASPNDPGVVVAPRINHSEYNHVMRDLTGLDLELGKLLVPDNQAGEGFVNVGGAQNMTVGQFEAYLATAKMVARHAVITPASGITWQPKTLEMKVTTPQGLRDIIAEQWRDWHDHQFDQWYKTHQRELKQSVDMFLGAYFEAAWRYQHRAKLGMPEATFDDIARDYDVRLLTNAVREIYKEVTENPAEHGLLAEWLSERWHALPEPTGQDVTSAREACRDLQKWVEEYSEGGDDLRGTIDPYEHIERKDRQQIRGKIHHGTWPFEIDLTKTEGKTLYLVVADGGDGNEGDYGTWENGVVFFGKNKKEKKPLHELGLDITATEGEQPSWQNGTLRVHAPSVLKVTMPDDATWFAIDLSMDEAHKETASIQTVIYDHPPESTGYIVGRGIPGAKRGGFKKAQELAGSVHFIGGLANKDHKHPREPWAYHAWPEGYARFYPFSSGYGWPQKTEPRGAFGPTSTEIHEHMNEEQLQHLEVMKQQAIGAAQPPLYDLAELLAKHLEGEQTVPEGVLPTDAQLAALPAEAKAEADGLITDAHAILVAHEKRAGELLQPLVEKAWRRSVTSDEMQPLIGFYREERQRGASFGGAVGVALSAALMHPDFLYRFNRRNDSDELRPLTGRELATRLSFTLWGSLPDDELLALGDRLQHEDVLREQLERMRTDERAAALALEFAAHWLQFFDFATHANPDAERFDRYGKWEIGSLMEQEARLFFADLFQNNRPITNVVDADYAFLNKALAGWYDVNGVKHDDFRRVELTGDDAIQRGGILGMGAVLVKYSEPLRTSAVRRGAWVHEHLLGIHLPSPPANVPLISDDERDEEGRSIREQLEEHRDNPACFSCHDKIDPPGIALEKFDAVGRWREQDIAKEPVDDQGTFVATGQVLDGVAGLRDYIVDQNREQFLEHFCHELLGYCLGRPVAPTDQPLLNEMMAALEANDMRPAAALEKIVLSQQFRYRRNSNL